MKNTLILTDNSNNIQFLKYKLDNNVFTQEKVKDFSHLGHRTPVRTISLSSDDSVFLTGSSESVKVWNTETSECIRTFESTYCTSSLFLPKDKYILVGDKEGNLTMYSI